MLKTIYKHNFNVERKAENLQNNTFSVDIFYNTETGKYNLCCQFMNVERKNSLIYESYPLAGGVFCKLVILKVNRRTKKQDELAKKAGLLLIKTQLTENGRYNCFTEKEQKEILNELEGLIL